MTPRFSIITTCKGRLEHLRRTLPVFLSFPDTETVVVDYGCPQQTAEVVKAEFPAAKLVKVNDDPGFNVGRARNLGAAKASGDVLLFFDADMIVSPRLMDDVAARMTGNIYGLFKPGKGNDLRGSFVVSRSDFEHVGGYDDLMEGYAGEDMELYSRLNDSGVARMELDNGLVEIIEHSDELRSRYHKLPKDLAFLVGLFYRHFTRMLRRTTDRVQLERKTRSDIYKQVRSLAVNLVKKPDPSLGFKLSITVPEDVIAGAFQADFVITKSYTLEIRPRDLKKFRAKFQSELPKA